MDIPVHADVLGTDGPVGKSTYVVVDLVSEKVARVVVQMDPHGDEYLVPVALIDDAARSYIHLTCGKKDDVAGMSAIHECYFNGYDSYGGSPPVPSGGAAGPTTLYHPYRLGVFKTN